MPGKLLVFEGPEGSGKSTQAAKILKYIRKKKRKTVLLREPGGTAISEKIRKIILSTKNSKMSPKAELLLYEAARAQIYNEKIRVLLKKGYIVILDRFFLATIVYQGYARGLDKKTIRELNSYTTDNIKPDLTIVYDVSMSEAARRMKKRGEKDRMEKESAKFHLKVRFGYLREAKKMKRCAVIKTDNKNLKQVFEETKALLKKRGF